MDAAQQLGRQAEGSRAAEGIRRAGRPHWTGFSRGKKSAPLPSILRREKARQTVRPHAARHGRIEKF